ncbi:flagellar motor switch protein FliM [Plasticicumulans acidivorans]|uniref:Flagellar motor switch protein FliM n=1 Tax=Plasticicumulans acidivorans TaxID=886464 RepID=A0A317MWM4_9GAMM|nr:FliM/FliN family flagellar motor switch protein [Plasticicumulans acidivorans]PWV63275.1 flagellar motor switch protein FliM [Plasticicumulans acidivorans]
MSSEGLLSQDELEALMESVADGRLSAARAHAAFDDEVRPYDLSNPDNVLAGILPILQTVQSRLAHQLGVAIYELLQRDVELQPLEVRAEAYQDFVARLKAPCAVNVIGLAPMAGPGLLIFDHPLVFALVGAYFGGPGTQFSELSRPDFTAAELRMIQRLDGLCARALASAWKPYLPVHFELLGHEVTPHFVTAINLAETLAVSAIELTIDGTRGTLCLALPVSMFEPVRGQLMASLAREHPVRDEGLRRLVEAGLRDAQVEARCVLAGFELSMQELLALRVGDVVPVDIPPQAVLAVDGVSVLNGDYGTTQGWRALKVDRWLVDLNDAAPRRTES